MEDFTPACVAHTKTFIETLDEYHPSSVVSKDNAECLQIAKMKKSIFSF